MPVDKDKMKALALAATPGPWRVGSFGGRCNKPSHAHGRHPGSRGDDPCVYTPFFMEDSRGIAGAEAMIVRGTYDGLEISDEDEHFIAIANPAAVLELLAENDKLDQERDELRAEVREWLCEACNTVYPGPPQKGFACVICPKCGGTTGPRVTMESRRLRAEVERLREVLLKIERVNAMDYEYKRWAREAVNNR